MSHVIFFGLIDNEPRYLLTSEKKHVANGARVPVDPAHAAACSNLELEVRKVSASSSPSGGTVIEASRRAEQCVPVLEIKPSQLDCV